MAKDNATIFRAGLEKYAQRTIKPFLHDVLNRVAERMVGVIDNDAFVPFEEGGNDMFPVYSGQMHDATGVAVYIDGMVSSYIPTAKATEPQYHNGISGIVGNTELQQAIAEAQSTFASGIWIVLFSSVPYAYEVDIAGSPLDRGIGYFESLENELFVDLCMNLKPVA